MEFLRIRPDKPILWPEKGSGGLFISIMCSIFLAISCTTESSKTKEAETASITNTRKRPKYVKKPPSTYPDTLTIGLPAAVFYYPDSLQQKKLKDLLDTSVYKAIMHDYLYQMRYARKVVNETWHSLKIIDSKNYRFLLFVKRDGSREYIDLDRKDDLYGLIVCDMKKDPVQIDNTNIKTQVSFYLNK